MLKSETHLEPMPTASRAALSSRHKTPAPHLRAADVVIPEKLYFRIGEVAQLCRLPAYVLRFWETEFPHLKPVKSSTGQRMYRHKESKTDKKQTPLPFPERASDLKYIRQGLKDILGLLSTRH
jgi:hypothetical protein